MSYDLKDDMLECFCGNSKYKHYYCTKLKRVIYYPHENTKTTQTKRCKFFHFNSNFNNCQNKNCNFQHIKDEEFPVYCESVGKYVLNEYVYSIHKKENNSDLSWFSVKSYEERDERRIQSELPNYIIQEEKDIQNFKYIKQLQLECKPILEYKPSAPAYSPNTPEYVCGQKRYFDEQPYSPTAPKYDDVYISNKKYKCNLPIEQQPVLNADSEWFENRSRNIKINNIGIIYYIKKLTGEKSWIHPYTGKTNLPGCHLTPSNAGLV
jgi:hypothetical protein